ncbi:MAG TPA: M42 family metallopeptidase [Spirochaetota bacterium]|nr:M42 family metallopeptidase [Spirochaetota bacterium]
MLEKKSMDFLKKLMLTPSPSGYEERFRKVWFDEMKKNSENTKIDVHGNAIAFTGGDNPVRIMLAGHMDEIGFQVKYIDDQGYIYFNTLGGLDINIIPGRCVRIHNELGDIPGVVGKKAIHLLEKEERDKPRKLHELYIDIGAKDKAETEKMIALGDPITYLPNYDFLLNDKCFSKAFDDKVGAFIVAEVLKKLHKEKDKLKTNVFSVATVQEEVGIRGAKTAAFGIDPHVGIAIDVTHATDTPDKNVKKDGEIKIGDGVAITRGPNVNPRLFKLLQTIAADKNIPYQIEANPRPSGTDANVIQVSREGTAAALLSIPCRYMHTHTEVISLIDAEAAIDLLINFALAVSEKTELLPEMY